MKEESVIQNSHSTVILSEHPVYKSLKWNKNTIQSCPNWIVIFADFVQERKHKGMKVIAYVYNNLKT